MAQAIVTSKGQITIPKTVREALKLDVGAKVEFLVLQDGDALLHPVTKTIDDVFGRLHNPEGHRSPLRKWTKASGQRSGRIKHESSGY